MNIDIETVKNLGSLIVYGAIIISAGTGLAKRRYNHVVIAIVLGGFAAFMINTPSNFMDMGQVIWDLFIGILEGGQDSNVFTK